jgi:hypothetical protein
MANTDYIYNPERFEQAGLRKGIENLGVRSTDIDSLCELGGRGYLFVEFKTYGTDLNKSQRMTFTRLLQDLKKPAFLVVASHTTEPEEEIAQNAFVDEVYWNIPESGEGLQYYAFDTTPDDDYLIPKYDGDLISLNHFLSEIVWTICPRLLTDKHELPAYDSRGPLPEMLKHWTENYTEELALEALTAAKRLRGLRWRKTDREVVNAWSDEQLASYLEKYGVNPEAPKEAPTAHVEF